MKEASGELSMTLVTIIAVAAIVGIVGLMWEPITSFIEDKWQDWTGNQVDLNPNK